jgi:hypothetical protein
MSPFLIALLFGTGIGTYVWSYLARTTGNAKVGSVIGGAAVVGLMAFLVLYTILKFGFGL